MSKDWKKGSRKRVVNEIENGNYKHPRYRRGLSKEALETFEMAKTALEKLDKQREKEVLNNTNLI